MDQNLSQIVEEIKGNLNADVVEGAMSLIFFATTYAITSELRHKALILKLNYARAESGERKQSLQDEMLKLVDDIALDYQTKAGIKGAISMEQLVQTAQDRLSNIPPPHDVVFACEGLGKIYRKSGFTLADVSLQLREGEITGAVGENGNGKTTLFRLIVGDLRHDAGSLGFPLLKQHTSTGIDWALVKQSIAYLPQELPRWYGSLEDNLQYEAAMHGILGEENLREVSFIIERLALAEHLEKSWAELSGGYKLRFALAKALVWKPSLLVIDEPLANLDFKAQQIILKDLRDLANSLRHPMSVPISSQHLHEVEAIANNILFLQKGSVTFNGPVEEIGMARLANTFEPGTSCDINRLRMNLQVLDCHQINHTGVAYVISAPLQVNGPVLLRHLLDAGIPVDYFRDISRSIKQLFH